MPCKKPFTKADIPDLSGKIALITGATGGLGLETALALASADAAVYVGGRNEAKGKDALDKIKASVPNAIVSFALIDHGSLASVKAFADGFNAKGQPLDILVNNAGVMGPPAKLTTSDNFEIQMGTNHFAHFALTARLLPSLRRSTYPARVVNVSSLAARQGKIKMDDLNWDKSYQQWPSYSQTKLANLLFTFELQRRSDAGGWGITALSAHPGISSTDLINNGPGESTITGMLLNTFMKPLFSQSSERGALPQIFAATSPEVEKCGYYGPNGFYEMKGDVGVAWMPPFAKDTEMAKKLWEESERLTGVSWAKD